MPQKVQNMKRGMILIAIHTHLCPKNLNGRLPITSQLGVSLPVEDHILTKFWFAYLPLETS